MSVAASNAEFTHIYRQPTRMRLDSNLANASSATLHLLTVVGAYVGVLPQMFDHYLKLGVNSIVVNIHAPFQEDPIIDQVTRLVSQYGGVVDAVAVCPWSQSVNHGLYRR